MTDSPLQTFKALIKRIPALGPALAYARGQSRINRRPQRNQPAPQRSADWEDSATYWESRYRTGGDSGTGSSGRLAEFKAEIMNEFVMRESIASVIEFGCGDGRQLLLAKYPKYVGVDVSGTVVEKCQSLFVGDHLKTFVTLDEYRGETAELALSMDVIFHLIEDEVFSSYMDGLFNAATRYVVIYSSNAETAPKPSAPHFRGREFTHWVAANRPDWRLIRHIPNRYPFNGDGQATSVSDFFVFDRA